jgi:hypothetical protein
LLIPLAASGAAADSQWTALGAPNQPAWSIAASPLHPDVLLEATQGHGIQRSTDSGSTWSTVWGPNESAWVVRFDPRQPQVAYAGTQASGFLRSENEGRTWTVQSQGLPLDVRSLETYSDLIVAGTSRGVYYSKDAAASWHGLGLDEMSVAAVAVLPKAGGVTLFAGVDNASTSNGFLFRSEDLTAGWSVVRGNLPGDVLVAALATGSGPSGGTEPPVLAGTSQGVFRSDDRGATWSQVSGLPLTDYNVVLFNQANPDQIYVASDGDQGLGGVLRSLDRGATWSPLGAGLPAKPRVTALGLQPLNPVQLLAATWNPTTRQVGVYRIADPAAALGSAAPAASVPPVVQPSRPAVIASARPHPGPTVARRIDYTGLAAGSLGLLLLGGIIWARRWQMRREDRRTYSA